jgi:hypothetical protein
MFTAMSKAKRSIYQKIYQFRKAVVLVLLIAVQVNPTSRLGGVVG